MRSVKSKLLIVCIVLGLLGAGQVVAAEYQYVRLLVDEDALVNEIQFNKNYGDSNDLLVGDVTVTPPWHDTGLCRSYLKFNVRSDVGGVLPVGATVVNAELLLMLHETYPGLQQRTVEACYVPNDDGWNEGSITWNNMPTANAATTGIVTSNFNYPNSYYCWNVTPDVQQAMKTVGDNGVYSTAMIVKREPSFFWNNFYSRDVVPMPDKRPYLEIVYTVPGKVVSSGSEGYNPQPGPGSTLIFGPGPPRPGFPPIPEDFFFPGSEPFEGVIPLGGGGTPMVIERKEGVYIPDGGQETVATQIVALNLKSTDPIEVEPYGPDSFFDVYVELDPAVPSEGSALIDAMGGGGGGGCTYQETTLNLRIEFVNTVTGLPADYWLIPGRLATSEIPWPWQEEPMKKEGELLGYDGFYVSEGQTAHSEFLNAESLPAGGLDYSTLQEVSPTFCITTAEQWQTALNEQRVRAVTAAEFEDYRTRYNENLDEGSEPYPGPEEAEFRPATLEVYEPPESEGGDLCDGLVMYWGENEPDDAEFVTAFRYTYPDDPDLTGCVLNTTVYPPCGMLVVSIGLQDINGNIRGWFWNVAAAPGGPTPPGTIPCSNVPHPGPGATPTNISIDLSKTGVAAATPVAASYSTGGAGFDLTQITDYQFDEDNNWIASMPTQTPGSGIIASWNYWYNIVVTRKTPPPALVDKTKFYIKYSQGPDIVDPDADPKLIRGWDERSNYHWRPVVADDWLCEDDRAVTDVHWWGSFLGWNQPEPPPVVPIAFHLGIWTDRPDPDPGNPDDFSHPYTLIWENYCESWAWEFYGYDLDPRWGDPDPTAPFEPWETCFQFEQFLSEDEWFYQDPNLPWPWPGLPDPQPNGTVYWLSIAAVYNAGDVVAHPWGWKTREPSWNDDAVRIWEVAPPLVDALWPGGFTAPNWPPSMGYTWVKGDPIWWPTEADSWDMCFELTTNEPAYEDNPIPGDSNLDGVVNFFDVAITAANWLERAPGF